tara:strand:+ start:574 stop:837 length:264 start_codon:yes stop_codon:yes gene_type:complete
MAKKTKDLKITKAELESVQTKVKSINTLQMQVGGLEIQKTVAIQRLNAVQNELSVVQQELEKKYGKVSVNLETGLIKEELNETDKKN